VTRISSRFVAVLFIVVSAGHGFTAEEEAGFRPLFDGKSLDGWVQRAGKAKYAVEDGTIVGTTVLGEPNSFLCTDRDYGDFILEVEFKVDQGLNSGVQIRSEYTAEPKPLDTTRSGKPVTVPANCVYGYQVEIDASDRAWSGGIYDEKRRAWLNDLKGKTAARKAFKQNEWNKFRIECKGDSIKTWINGVPAADLKDGMTPKGFIALQVHSTKSETPLQVRWRNIKIKEL
jgi:hypothetical protein